MWLKPDPIGPQRAIPASPARLRAQHAQTVKQWIESGMDVTPDERYCSDCSTILNVLVSKCSYCGHENSCVPT